MKFGSSLLLAFAMMLSTHFAFAQGEDQKCNDSETEVAAARSAYTSDETCPPRASATAEPIRGSRVALGQFPSRMPGPPRRTRPGMGYPPPTYQRRRGQVNGRHIAIGAVVGLGLGALVGSRGGAKVAFAFGALGSGLGAAFGAGIPPLPPRRYRAWPDYGDEEASRSRSRPSKPAVARGSESEKEMFALGQTQQ